MGDLSFTHEPEAQRAAADLSRKQGKGGCILSLGSRQAGIDPFLGGWGGGASKPSQVTMLQRARFKYGYSTNNHPGREERGRLISRVSWLSGVVFLGGGGYLGLHSYPFYLVHEGPPSMLASRAGRFVCMARGMQVSGKFLISAQLRLWRGGCPTVYGTCFFVLYCTILESII